MKVEKLDHIHLIVNDIEGAMKAFKSLLGGEFVKWGEEKEVLELSDEWGVRMAFHPFGLELIQATDDKKIQSTTIGGKGGMPDSRWKQGVTALSFKVPDLEAALEEMQGKGWKLIFRSEVGQMKDASLQFPGVEEMLIELTQYQGDHATDASKTSNDEAGHSEGSLRSATER